MGEILDRETAGIAVQASLTGHLLLSTLHTRGTVESLLRLIDMGCEPYLVKEVVTCAIAQRLVRTPCNACKEPYQPAAEDVYAFLSDTFFRPRGAKSAATRATPAAPPLAKCSTTTTKFEPLCRPA